MTSKIKTIISGSISGISGFISWLATVPPEQQSGMLAQLVETLPLEWRPTVGLWAKTLGTISLFYSLYQASRSGPSTPPANKPQ